jgi:hypothetical protein
MKKLLTLTLGLVILALTVTKVMGQRQTNILNTNYNQRSQRALLPNFANGPPTTAESALALSNFDYDFEKLVNDRTIFGQGKWVNSNLGDVAVRKGPGINQTQTAKGGGGSTATGAIRPLDQAFYYTTKDTSVVWGVWGYVPSSSSNMNALGGILPCVFGPWQLGGLTKLTTFLARQLPLPYLTGDGLLYDHWYEYRVIVDFSVPGGSATLSYRDVTGGATAFTNDRVIHNVNLGLVPDGSGRYGFFDVAIRNEVAAYVDNLHFDAPAPSNPQKKGMTWFHTASNATYGTITVGCGPDGPNRCDPAHGDTLCTQQLPVLCIYKPKPAFPLPVGLPIPNQYNEWSGGVVATTPPHAGTFKDTAEVNKFCSNVFGPGWRVAEFHDGVYWNFQAYGGTVSAPTVPSTRFWVYINDQLDGNCWQP